MRVSSLLALLLFLVGGALLFHGARIGEGEVYLFLVFPVFVIQGPISLAGSLLVFASIFMGFLSLSRLSSTMFPGAPTQTIRDHVSMPPAEVTKRRKFGGIVLVGPVPVVFGSDVRTATAMLIGGIVLTVILLLLLLTSLGG